MKTVGKMEEARRARAAQLPRLGWKASGSYWINPRSGRRYDRETALAIEDLRGTFVNERMKEYRKQRVERDDE